MERRALYSLLIAGSAFADTTGNLLDGSGWSTSGDVNFWSQGDNPTWVYSYTQGIVSQTVDLSAYDQIDRITYGASSLGCNNYVGGHCGSSNPSYYDEISVQLSYGNESWTDTVTLDYNAGWIDYDFDVVPTGQAESLMLSFTSFDPGFWAGYYASATTDAYLIVDHSVAALPAPEPIPVAADPVIQTAVLDTIITPDPVIEVTPTVDVAMPGVDVTPTVDVATVDVVAEPQPAADAPQTDSSPADAPQDSSQPSGGESQQKDNGGGGSGPTAVATVMASIDVASASIDTIQDIAGDPASPVAQALAMLVMSAQGVQLEDIQLDQPELPKEIALTDRGLREREWRGALVDDAKWKRMVESQWK